LLTPGSIDIVPLGYASSWEEDGPTTVFSAHIEPSLLQSTAETMGINADTVTVAPSMQTRDQKIEHIAWALKAEIESSTPYDRLYADSLGTALAAHLLRRNMPAQPIPPKYGLGKRQLRRVVDYISAHLASDLSLLEMAEVAGASPSHFRFLFKCSTGVPLHQYVIRCRVQSAMQLLSRRSLTLNDVAAQCGFADQSHMARCMRRVIGMTPTAYLRNI
jgi:AraC family transcriptional regulator